MREMVVQPPEHRRNARRTAILAIFIGVVATCAPMVNAVGASAGTCATDFVIVHTPAYLPNEELLSVDVLSSSSAWAVGQTEVVGKTYDPALAMHWDGASWNPVAVPVYGQDGAKLEGVAPISDTDVWATGYTASLGGRIYDRPLAVHWNGSHWRRFSIPLPADAQGATLWRTEAMSSDDVWAVGWYHTNRSGRAATLIEHWNGSAWSLVPSPNLSTKNNMLRSVTAVGPDQAYAVGRAGGRILIERWNGTKWSIERTHFGTQEFLRDVDASSSGRVVAVGITNQAHGAHGLLLARRATGWHRIFLAGLGSATLDGVAWAGTRAYAVGLGRDGAFALEKSGAAWERRTVALAGYPYLNGVGASPDGSVWAVGIRDSASGDSQRSVAERPCST